MAGVLARCSCRHKGSGRRRSSPSGACARRTAPGRRDRLPDLYEPHVPRRPKTVQDAQLCARCPSAMAMATLSAGGSAREASSLRLSSTSSPGSLWSSSSSSPRRWKRQRSFGGGLSRFLTRTASKPQLRNNLLLGAISSAQGVHTSSARTKLYLGDGRPCARRLRLFGNVIERCGRTTASWPHYCIRRGSISGER